VKHKFVRWKTTKQAAEDYDLPMGDRITLKRCSSGELSLNL